MISISEKSSVEIFLRNGFLNSAHFSTIGPTLKPFGLERVNKTPLALGLSVDQHDGDITKNPDDRHQQLETDS